VLRNKTPLNLLSKSLPVKSYPGKPLKISFKCRDLQKLNNNTEYVLTVVVRSGSIVKKVFTRNLKNDGKSLTITDAMLK